MRTVARHPRAAGRRGGMALPTALLVLLVLTLLGTAAVFTSSTELMIAGNGRQDLHALSVAEAGVHEALARLSMKTAGPEKITAAVDVGGNPIAGWSLDIVNESSPGAGETQTLTGAFGSPAALPISTTVAYKIEDDQEKPLPHCDGSPPGSACGGDVVKFHTAFNYGGGSNVPTGAQNGVPVLQLTSRYEDASGTSKRLVVEAVRLITNVNTPGTVRACGDVTCQGANRTDGTLNPQDGTAIVGKTVTGCDDSKVDPDPSTNPDALKVQSCPADVFLDTFGITKAQMLAIADIVQTAPYQPPDGMDGKIVYVTGSTQTNWTGNNRFGCPANPSDPVTRPTIVVYEGDLRTQGTTDFCGILYVMGSLVIGAGDLNVRGAVVVEKDANLDLTGNARLTYDPDAVKGLPDLAPYTTILWSER